jgi:hypothetical protein
MSERNWKALLSADPIPWLLEESNPAVRHATLVSLLGRAADDPEVIAAGEVAMVASPIVVMLAAQQPGGYWIAPGLGYQKYQGTAWQLIFLDQMGADGSHPGIIAGCEHLLQYISQPQSGLFVSSRRTDKRPLVARLFHCLAGNLLRAFLGFGWLDDERVKAAIDWQARAITGTNFEYYPGDYTNGPGFQCQAHWGLPCAWGAIKILLAFARIPEPLRSPLVRQVIQMASDFLLSRDLLTADYPTGQRSTTPSLLWWRPGFPIGYHADILQSLEALGEAGYGRGERLQPALEWLLERQDGQGRWRNRHSYHAKMWVDIEKQGAPSKWVTWRVCQILKRVYG